MLYSIIATLAISTPNAQESVATSLTNCRSIKGMLETKELFLLHRKENDEGDIDRPGKKSIILVSIENRGLWHFDFITPCLGYELRLVPKEVYKENYTTTITDKELDISVPIEGEYELQIIPDNQIYYTQITF